MRHSEENVHVLLFSDSTYCLCRKKIVLRAKGVYSPSLLLPLCRKERGFVNVVKSQLSDLIE